jgi:nucleoside-diphosphate-sugar epimerase
VKILITGGNGFLGSNIIRRLVSENNNVYVFSNNINNIKDILDKIEFDCGHTKDIIKYKNKIINFEPEIIIHCGWSGGNNHVNVNDLEQVYENIEPGIAFINLINELPKKPKFIGFGSFSEYGQYNFPVNENTTENPINLYGLSKYTFKNYSKLLCDLYNINWTWIRPCYIYGPYDITSRLVPLVINKFLQNEDLILDDCNKVIDYLYIDDFVDYVIDIITKNSTGVYNICSGKEYHLKDLILKIKTLVDSKSSIIFDSNLNRKFTSNYICGDNTKIKQTTNIEPKVDLETGILKTINYYKNRK